MDIKMVHLVASGVAPLSTRLNVVNREIETRRDEINSLEMWLDKHSETPEYLSQPQ